MRAAPVSLTIPSRAMRIRQISSKRVGVIIGRVTERVGSISSARSATSRRSASRTGIGLVPSAAAMARMVIVEPGRIAPDMIAFFSS